MKYEENTELRTKIAKKELPQIKIFHVPIAGGYQGVVRMILPNEINFEGSDERTKYPMLVRVYAGPGSIRVLNTFSVGYQSYQVTKKKIIYAEIDGRGMSQNGLGMMFSVNNKLGSYEIEDQIAVTKYLVDKYKFIDPERVSIWGWWGGWSVVEGLKCDFFVCFQVLWRLRNGNDTCQRYWESFQVWNQVRKC